MTRNRVRLDAPDYDGLMAAPEPATGRDESAEHDAYLLGWREALDAMEEHVQRERALLARIWGSKWKK